MRGRSMLALSVAAAAALTALTAPAAAAPVRGTHDRDGDEDGPRKRLTLAIASPVPHTATNAARLAVQLRLGLERDRSRGRGEDRDEEDEDGPPKARALVLLLDGVEVARREQRNGFRTGLHTLTLDLAGAAEGAHELRALAYAQRGRTRKPPLAESVPQTLLVDQTAPQLSISSPTEGEFVAEPLAHVRGSVADAVAGLALVTCNGVPATVAGGELACTVPLAEGPNTIVVRALDLAGNARAETRAVEHVPGGLGGAPDEPALEAVEDVLTADANTAPDEVGVDAAGRRLSRTKLEIGFAADATVADLNELLRSIDGSVVSSLADTPVFAVRVPDTGTTEALLELESGLEASEAVEYVNLVGFHEPGLLPGNVDPSDGAHLGAIDHQLAVRAHAAWNASSLLAAATPPTLVIGDFFGEGRPDSFFDVAVSRPADFATGNPDPVAHGYHVLGVASAFFDDLGAASFARDVAVGMYPATLPLRAVDYQSGLDDESFDRAMIDAIRATSGKVVLNTSVHGPCRTPAEAAANCSPAKARELALAWQAKVRGVGLENRFLHLTIAGNVDVPGDTAASTASRYAASRLLPLTLGGSSVAKLSNVLVVENQVADGSPFRPLCLNASSKRGGNLSGIGTDVWSLTATSAGEASGTSQAAPQVAGLAAFLWSLDPFLTPQQVATRLQDTARPGSAGSGTGCDSATPAPSIDAYAAVLSADTGDPALPVRAGILDQDGVGGFDEAELAAFVAAFDAAAGAVDYSRHDLNGDGRTGGAERDRFDLDADLAADKWSDSQEQTIQTLPIRYADAQLTDADVLCYYAHTDLYTGDTAIRDQFAAEHCLTLDLQTTFPAIVTPGAATTLTVNTVRPNGLPQPDVHLELTPTGGTVADFGGVTDAAGSFQTSAHLFSGQTQLTIEIVARAGAGGPELARATVRANAAGGNLRIFSRRAFATVFLIACDPFQACVNGGRAAHMPGFDLTPFAANVGNTVTKGAVTVSASGTNDSRATLAGGVATVSLLGTARSSFSAPSPADQQAIATGSSRHEVGFASDSRISYTFSGSASAGEGSGLAGVQIRDQNGIVHVDVTAGAGTSRSVAAAGTLPAGLYHVALFAECASSTRPPLPDCPQSTIDATVQLSG